MLTPAKKVSLKTAGSQRGVQHPRIKGASCAPNRKSGDPGSGHPEPCQTGWIYRL